MLCLAHVPYVPYVVYMPYIVYMPYVVYMPYAIIARVTKSQVPPCPFILSL